MRSMWKGTISFGLVNIPIALGVATQRSDPKFRTLDEKTLQPIRQQLFSPARGDEGETISRDETVKGYEVSKDTFVVVSDEELESVAVERRRTIDIVAFVDQSEVDPVYFDRSYYVAPQENAEKPYALLLEAMKATGKAALGKIVLSSREHLALLRPAGDALVIELLFYPEDVREKDEIEETVEGVKVTKAELDMAEELVDSLTQSFEPEQFSNEHKDELMALIEKKVAGEEITIAEEADEPAPVPDLMAALKASLDQKKPEETSSAGRGEAASSKTETVKKAAAKKKEPAKKPAAKKKEPAAKRTKAKA
ncbi:MAG: Ku protein [Thermoleophilaceae bacterium]|nr:Ku protein [Thermoleophilaceae bacterium]